MGLLEDLKMPLLNSDFVIILEFVKCQHCLKKIVFSNAFFFIHTYTHAQFEQLHKHIQKRNKSIKVVHTKTISRYKIVWYIQETNKKQEKEKETKKGCQLIKY